MHRVSICQLMKRAIVLAPWVVLALLPASAAANPPTFTCTTVQFEVALSTARLNQLIQGFFGGNLSALDAELKKQGITLADVRANLTEQLLTERLYERVTKGVTATRARALHYYRHNQRQFRTPPMRGVRHILVTSRARAWRLYWNVHRNPTANFGGAARKYSQDPSSAGQGGALMIARGQTVPEFDRTAFSRSC